MTKAPPWRRVNSKTIMKTKLSSLSEQYLAALRTHLEPGPMGNLQPAGELGRQALGIGLQTLDLARMHNQALTAISSADNWCGVRDGTITRAEKFFAEAITPIEESHRAVMEANVNLKQQIATLHERAVQFFKRR